MSHPAWVCGLKPITRVLWKYSMSHTLRGCVDWNIRTMTAMYPYVVTPCVGVWIETTRSANFSFKSPCHTLRGCVDWNSYGEDLVTYEMVTPCVGVWIETTRSANFSFKSPCHTLRGCVDWNSYGEDLVTYEMVTPCVGVWIETIFINLVDVMDWVTPCVGVWIETLADTLKYTVTSSHPAWVCGLKHSVLKWRKW